MEGSGPGNYQVLTERKIPSKEMWRYEYKYLLGQPPLSSSHFTDGEGSERLFNDCVSGLLALNPMFTLLHKTQWFIKS